MLSHFRILLWTSWVLPLPKKCIIKLQHMVHWQLQHYTEGCFTQEVMQLRTCTIHMLFLQLKREVPSEGFCAAQILQNGQEMCQTLGKEKDSQRILIFLEW